VWPGVSLAEWVALIRRGHQLVAAVHPASQSTAEFQNLAIIAADNGTRMHLTN